MDSNLVIADKIKKDIENCVILTNSVINRWITINNVSPKKIYNEDIDAVFFGYLKKAMTRHTERYWKKVSKCIYLTVGTNKFITNICYRDIDTTYWKDKHVIDMMCKSFDTIDYIKLQETLIVQDRENINLNYNPGENLDLNVSIDFSKLEAIRF